jgi:hypothetical protein
MRTELCEKLEKGRVRAGPMASDKRYGPYGMFHVIGPLSRPLFIMASGGDRHTPWEHVSVSMKKAPPTWVEMCWVKDLFWHDHECVMQLHPPKADYVNNVSTCLHLWRPHHVEIPRPPAHLVGDRALGTLR